MDGLRPQKTIAPCSSGRKVPAGRRLRHLSARTVLHAVGVLGFAVARPGADVVAAAGGIAPDSRARRVECRCGLCSRQVQRRAFGVGAVGSSDLIETEGS
jgi:hypothetical protein